MVDGEQNRLEAPPLEAWPRVSIVTPSYNQAQFLEEAIRSVLLQGYPNLEYIIIDGGSTDGSVDIIRKYEPWLAYWISEPDRGQSHAINKGLTRASGKILSWLNSDDLLLRDALVNVAQAYAERPNAAAWVGECHRIAPDHRILTTVVPGDLSRESLAAWEKGNRFYQPSCFFSRTAWARVGSLDESLHYALDFDLWLRLAALGDLVPVDAVLSAAYIHDDAKTQAGRLHMHAETIAVQVRHGHLDAAAAKLEELLAKQSLSRRVLGAARVRIRSLFRWLGSLAQDRTESPDPWSSQSAGEK